MGLAAELFPVAKCFVPTENGAFLWANISGVMGFLNLILFVSFLVISVISFGIGIVLFPFLLITDFTMLLTQLMAMTFHFISCTKGAAFADAFIACGINKKGVGVLNTYNTIVHILLILLSLVGIGIFMIPGIYVVACIHFLIACFMDKD